MQAKEEKRPLRAKYPRPFKDINSHLHPASLGSLLGSKTAQRKPGTVGNLELFTSSASSSQHLPSSPCGSLGIWQSLLSWQLRPRSSLPPSPRPQPLWSPLSSAAPNFFPYFRPVSFARIYEQRENLGVDRTQSLRATQSPTQSFHPSIYFWSLFAISCDLFLQRHFFLFASSQDTFYPNFHPPSRQYSITSSKTVRTSIT